MIRPLNTILFATNLSDSCATAFELATGLAVRYQATLVLLHVVEKAPGYVEARLKALLGESEWDKMMGNQAEDAQKALIAKKTSNTIIRDALNHFCSMAGIEDNSCDYHSREIVVSNGDVVEDILYYAKTFNTDIIIMGARKGMLSETAIGSTIKSVLKKSKRPVMVVPSETETNISVEAS
jgi:nucleotide-binding universal stress UspA family protein